MSTATKHIDPEEMPLQSASPLLDPTLEQVLLRIRLCAQRRIAWLRKIWTEVGDASGNGHASHLEIDGYLNQADTPSAEVAWYAITEEVQELNEAILEVENELAQNENSRLSLLQRIFGLDEIEVNVLHICLTLSIEPKLDRILAYLNDHSARGYITEALVARLFGHGYCLSLSPESPLKVWGLIIETPTGNGNPSRLECDPFLRNWLLGKDDLDEALTSVSNLQEYHKPLTNWPIEETTNRITSLLENPTTRRVRLFVSGAEGSGRRTFSACIAAQLGLPLLAIDSSRISQNNWEFIFMRAQRYAYLNRCALVWHGKTVQENPWPQYIPAFQVQFLTGEVDEFLPPTEGFLDLRIELPTLDSEQRRDLWFQMVPSVSQWPIKALDTLVRRRQVNIGQIIAVATHSVKNAEEAAEAISTSSRRRLGKLAQHLTSDFRWEDLIVNSKLRGSLEEFTFEATERILLWEEPEAQRLFPQGRGLLALFAGPPGTGKTMAAQVIANTLQLDLYRVDLSTIVSKYVGETSKNIERILSRAQRMDAVLLFDEADALFGKRTDIKDAHDRFANTDTNYLLQAIEQYPGIAILASNRKANIDKGFTRRLRYVLDFPRPDAAQRLLLWQQILSELAGTQPVEVVEKDLFRLANMQEITGAQIKYAVLSAIYLARREQSPITLTQLVQGLERELMKEGRGLGRQANELLKRRS